MVGDRKKTRGSDLHTRTHAHTHSHKHTQTHTHTHTQCDEYTLQTNVVYLGPTLSGEPMSAAPMAGLVPGEMRIYWGNEAGRGWPYPRSILQRFTRGRYARFMLALHRLWAAFFSNPTRHRPAYISQVYCLNTATNLCVCVPRLESLVHRHLLQQSLVINSI